MFRRAFQWSRKKPASDDEVFIKGERVIIREKRIADVPEDYAWRVDEELARLDATRPLNMAYDAFLRYSEEELAFPNPRSKRLAIDTHDGKHIGNCMYYDIDLRRGEAELGIVIGDRDYLSQGYGTDCVNSLLDHLFINLSFNRVYLHTLEWNHRARRSFAKSGFREVRSVRRSGMDFIFMEVSRTDWERRRSSANGEERAVGEGKPGESAGPSAE